MSREQFLLMVNHDPELDPVLNKAIEIWDAQLSQLQHPQIHQTQQQPQFQQPTQEQQLPIPENLNSENDSDGDGEWDDPMDIVFGIKRKITLQIPHGLTRGPIIYQNNWRPISNDVDIIYTCRTIVLMTLMLEKTF